MRIPICCLLMCSLLGAAEPGPVPPRPVASGESRTMNLNPRISSRQINLNQAVRIDFTTNGRQVENVDIAAAVVNGVSLSGASAWRLLGRPMVTESEKPRTVTVVFSLMPRTTGDLRLPQFPLTWLSGEPLGDLGSVTVAPAVLVGGETRELPRECGGIGGIDWGAKLDDLRAAGRLPQGGMTATGNIQVLKGEAGIEWTFRGGELAEAAILAPGLGLEQAQGGFLARWGLPQETGAEGPVWVLGWVRINARATTDGVRVHLLHEGIAARLARSQVQNRVFDLLDGPVRAGPTPR